MGATPQGGRRWERRAPGSGTAPAAGGKGGGEIKGGKEKAAEHKPRPRGRRKTQRRPATVLLAARAKQGAVGVISDTNAPPKSGHGTPGGPR